MINIGHAIHNPQLMIVQHFYPSRPVALHIEYGIFRLTHVYLVKIIVHQDVRTTVVIEVGNLDHFHDVIITVGIFKYIFYRGREGVISISETHHNPVPFAFIGIHHHLVRHAIAVQVFKEDAVRPFAAFVYGTYMVIEIHSTLVDGKSLTLVPTIVDDP